jgi:hypothetical protein
MMNVKFRIKHGNFSYCDYKNVWAITKSTTIHKSIIEIVFNTDEYNYAEINIGGRLHKSMIYKDYKVCMPIALNDNYMSITFYIAKYPCLFVFFPSYTISHIETYNIPSKEILGSNICSICLEECRNDEYISFCKHIHHMDCMIKYIENCKNLLVCECNNICIKKFDCPVCRSIIS